MKTKKEKYIAFLRGINVGGHHKVPMAELRYELEEMGFQNVVTILNSGNVIFDGRPGKLAEIEAKIASRLAKVFKFPIPTILRKADLVDQLLEVDPFADVDVTKDIRLYVSFLQEDTEVDLSLPWTTDDRSFTIVSKIDATILSVLDLSITNTPKGMEALEKIYGKDMTTRNWKTIHRLDKKLKNL